MTMLNSSGLEYLGTSVSTLFRLETAKTVELQGKRGTNLRAFISLGKSAILICLLAVYWGKMVWSGLVSMSEACRYN